jgi:hypothetical protein
VKKVWLVVALVAFAGLAVSSFADVQNIRLSGDIRLRGYWMDNVSDVSGDGTDSGEFISQRTRVSVEADLEDHVLVVVTLKAEGLWGAGNDVSADSGTGLGRGFDVGINEAYVQLNEVFYTPATLKLGRQGLHYGRGLIISSVEQEYNFDAARLVLDYYPLTVDLVYARALEGSSFGNDPFTSGEMDLVFLNGRYELSDSLIKNVEAYFGALMNRGSAGATPRIVGLRSDMNLTKSLQTWVEGAYEFGQNDSGEDLSAFLLNVGGRYSLKDVKWTPVINFGWTYASGDDNAGGEHEFVPWFDYVEGYNGYVLSPRLANIHIFNVGGSIKPAENTTLAVQGYYYLRDRKGGPDVIGNPSIDNGGISEDSESISKELGWEIDVILGYDYSKDVRCQLVYGAFIPDRGYNASPFDGNDESAVAHEIRGEVVVKF